MEKDNSILRLIDKVRSQKKYDSISIVDYWDGDLCAIGLQMNNKLFYISTYNLLSNNSGYDFDIELLNSGNLDLSTIIKSERGVSEKQLFEEINSVFSID